LRRRRARRSKVLKLGGKMQMMFMSITLLGAEGFVMMSLHVVVV
jgi:hypothetical protein